MKKIILAVTTALLIAGTAYAGVQCIMCRGTGWRGQFKCSSCGGDGVIGN